MRNIVPVFLFLLVNQAFSQSYSRAEIEQIASSKNVKFDTIKTYAFVLEGVPFEKDKIELELRKYSKVELKYIEAIDLSIPIRHRYEWAILIGKIYQQRKKEKLKIIKNLRTNLNENIADITIRDYRSKAKIVSVNGDILSEKVSRNYVNRLKIKDIEFVLTYENPNPLFYGERAENELVEIYLKKK